jgi:hypothetical protein
MDEQDATRVVERRDEPIGPDAATRPPPGELRWRPSPGVRKLILLAHIASSGAWLGIDLVLGALVLGVVLPGDELPAAAALVSLGAFATWPLAVVGLLSLITGLLLGIGSRYGLVRYWWVAVKLVLNVVLVVLVVFALSPNIDSLGAAGRMTLTDGVLLPDTRDLMFPPVVSTTCVLFAMTLSVFKPWGRVRRRLGG